MRSALHSLDYYEWYFFKYFLLSSFFFIEKKWCYHQTRGKYFFYMVLWAVLVTCIAALYPVLMACAIYECIQRPIWKIINFSTVQQYIYFIYHFLAVKWGLDLVYLYIEIIECAYLLWLLFFFLCVVIYSKRIIKIINLI